MGPSAPSNASGSDGDEEARRRATTIRRVAYEFLSRRSQGEDVQPEEIQRNYPELMPELEGALAAVLRSSRRVADARRAWGTAPTGGIPNFAYGTGASPTRVEIRGYRLRREIRSGGQGTVFEAVHEATGRTVAVKVLTGISRTAVSRFDREAQALAAVDHPGLVGILDRGLTKSGACFIAMDFIQGVDLDEWLNTNDQQRDVMQVVTLFAKIAAALAAAHSRGIIHRDIKPSNVRVDASDNPRIIDFGLAHLTHGSSASNDRRLTMTHDIVGSVAWLSPEQASASAGPIGPPSDVYAVGVMLYHALTQQYPYAVDGPPLTVLRNICELRPKDPTAVNKRRVNQGLAAILRKCLAKSPADRYQDGGQLSADLHGFVAGSFRPPRRMTLSPRHQSLIVTTVVLLVAIAVLAIRYPLVRSSTAVLPVDLPRFTNQIGMEFVELRAGRFKMGSPHDESGKKDDEQPHVVQISRAFNIGRTEVTRAQYLRVMGVLPTGVVPEPDNSPVDRVTPDEAREFCRKLGEIDGWTYRLPTEAEWEYACRAEMPGPFTVPVDRIDEVAWHAGNSGGTLKPVGAKEPNRWGLFDMHGNAAEITADYYVPFLGSDERIDPVYRVGGMGVVVRGGRALDPPGACRSASRESLGPRVGRSGVGFRVVCASGKSTDEE